MRRPVFWLTAGLLAIALACSGDDAKKAADTATDAADTAVSAADGMADRMANTADAAAAAAAADAAKSAAGAVATDAVAACRSLAESGAWGKALEVCRKAHELKPDDLAIEHALQQAEAAAAS